MIPDDRPPSGPSPSAWWVARRIRRPRRPLAWFLALLPALYLVFGAIWWQLDRRPEPLWAGWARPQFDLALSGADATPASTATPDPPAIAVATLAPITARPTERINLRTEPTRRSASRAIVTPQDDLELIDFVEGEAVEAGENRWVMVRHGELSGYVYWPFVTWDGKSESTPEPALRRSERAD